MKRLLIVLAILAAMAMPARALDIEHTNVVSLILTNVCDGEFNDFALTFSGYDGPQNFKFTYDVSLTNTTCRFRILRPIEGTVYVDVPATNITVANTSVTWSIARAEMPAPGNYYGELLSYESTETNVTRSIAQGRIAITWSLFLNGTNCYVP